MGKDQRLPAEPVTEGGSALAARVRHGAGSSGRCGKAGKGRERHADRQEAMDGQEAIRLCLSADDGIVCTENSKGAANTPRRLVSELVKVTGTR